jgi:hypothetical protein
LILIMSIISDSPVGESFPLLAKANFIVKLIFGPGKRILDRTIRTMTIIKILFGNIVSAKILLCYPV